ASSSHGSSGGDRGAAAARAAVRLLPDRRRRGVLRPALGSTGRRRATGPRDPVRAGPGMTAGGTASRDAAGGGTAGGDAAGTAGTAAHVVATAGHVDHGKSALVRSLTGMEPDRLAEEQRRGLTIDLGFAWTTLPSGHEIGLVDVPGHERLIR